MSRVKDFCQSDLKIEATINYYFIGRCSKKITKVVLSMQYCRSNISFTILTFKISLRKYDFCLRNKGTREGKKKS